MNPYKMVIAVANQKGGCAKTTTAVNLAAALAKGNRNVKVSSKAKVLLDGSWIRKETVQPRSVLKRRIRPRKPPMTCSPMTPEKNLPLMEEYLLGPRRTDLIQCKKPGVCE